MPKFVKGKQKTGGIQRGTKQPKTILKEELGLNSTKDLARFVITEGNTLFKEAQDSDDWNKKYLVWKELAKAGLPKTVLNVDESFEDYLKRYNG